MQEYQLKIMRRLLIERLHQVGNNDEEQAQIKQCFKAINREIKKQRKADREWEENRMNPDYYEFVSSDEEDCYVREKPWLQELLRNGPETDESEELNEICLDFSNDQDEHLFLQKLKKRRWYYEWQVKLDGYRERLEAMELSRYELLSYMQRLMIKDRQAYYVERLKNAKRMLREINQLDKYINAQESSLCNSTVKRDIECDDILDLPRSRKYSRYPVVHLILNWKHLLLTINKLQETNFELLANWHLTGSQETKIMVIYLDRHMNGLTLVEHLLYPIAFKVDDEGEYRVYTLELGQKKYPAHYVFLPSYLRVYSLDQLELLLVELLRIGKHARKWEYHRFVVLELVGLADVAAFKALELTIIDERYWLISSGQEFDKK